MYDVVLWTGQCPGIVRSKGVKEFGNYTCYVRYEVKSQKYTFGSPRSKTSGPKVNERQQTSEQFEQSTCKRKCVLSMAGICNGSRQ